MICSSCRVDKDLPEFNKGQRYCRQCQKEKKADWHQTNKTIANAYSRAYDAKHSAQKKERMAVWAKANRESINARKAKYNRENPTVNRDRVRQWGISNPDKRKAAARRYDVRYPHMKLSRKKNYEARKLRAMPKWANSFFIQEIYGLAKMRREVTGGDWHVDHIVPLRSPDVCGLHVEYNLRVISAKANMAKSNKYWPDMP